MGLDDRDVDLDTMIRGISETLDIPTRYLVDLIRRFDPALAETLTLDKPAK